MYQIEAMAEDVKMIKAMYEVLGEFADGREFCCKDIPIERRKAYFKPKYDYRNHYFSGSALHALVRRGILEKTRKEDYIYEYKDYCHSSRRGYHEEIQKAVGTRQYYRCVVPNVEEYQRVLAELTFRKIMSM